MSISVSDLVAKYINNTGLVFQEIKTSTTDEVKLSKEKIHEVIEYARNYFEDAKYHRDQKKFEVALTSVAYCEGLLDALRLLGVAEFRWPTKE
jgi:FAD synthetase